MSSRKIRTSHLLRALNAEADVAALVTDGDEGLEAGDLTGGRHLLHGHDLHNLVLQLRAKEEVHDLVLCSYTRPNVRRVRYIAKRNKRHKKVKPLRVQLLFYPRFAHKVLDNRVGWFLYR